MQISEKMNGRLLLTGEVFLFELSKVRGFPDLTAQLSGEKITIRSYSKVSDYLFLSALLN